MPGRQRLHRAADVALPLGENVDKGFAVERISTAPCANSGLSKGGLSRLMIRLVLALPGASSQIACGAWFFTSFSIGIDTSNGKVMSNLPAMKESIAVERFGMIVYSMPSR